MTNIGYREHDKRKQDTRTASVGDRVKVVRRGHFNRDHVWETVTVAATLNDGRIQDKNDIVYDHDEYYVVKRAPQKSLTASEKKEVIQRELHESGRIAELQSMIDQLK